MDKIPEELKIPENFQVGYCKTVRITNLPELIQQQLNLNPDRTSSLFFHTDVNANGIFKATEIALEKCEASLDVVRINYYNNFKIDRFDVFVEGTNKYFFDQQTDYDFPFDFLEVEKDPEWFENETYLHYPFLAVEDMSTVVAEEWPKSAKDLGRRLKNAIHLLALSRFEGINEIKLMLLFSALEAMLLSDSDKDSIASKLSERVAFLLSPKQTRLDAYDYMKTLYNKRSRFVHQNDKKNGVTIRECYNLDCIVTNVFSQLNALLFSGWEGLQERHDPAISVIDYIHKLKFYGDDDSNS